MDFEKAKKAAQDYFEQKGITGLASALETNDYWIFYGGQKDVVVYGRQGIKINKSTEEVSKFILPNKENFMLLKSATEIEI